MRDIEKKAFGPDSTPKELETLRSRVYMHSDDVIIYHEVPLNSVFQVGVMFEKIETLIDKSRKYYLLIDLTIADKPTAEVRAKIAGMMQPLKDNIIHCAMFTGQNVFVNILAKFVMGGVGFSSYSISKDIQGALAQCARHKS